MRIPAVLAVCAFMLLAGCSARGSPDQDPFAYVRKDLAHTAFDLAATAGKSDEQKFRVEDGSVARIKLIVWVNATAGNATVDIYAPSGRDVLSTQQSTTLTVPVDLGVWRFVVHASPGANGSAALVAVRAGTTTSAS